MNTVAELINSMNTSQLLNMKAMIEDKIDEYYHLPENFYLHEKFDDYLYNVMYQDGSKHLYSRGADAYRELIKNNTAIGIIRHTKDLFPVYELMMVKETKDEREQEEIRHKLYNYTMQTNHATSEQEKRLRHNRFS